MIRVDNLSKSFGDVKAVNDISFTIRDGEITGLLGPNGAGKTTSLRMITGYLKPDNGSVMVGDYNIKEDPLSVKKIIGYLPEMAPIYNEMLVYDYLFFVAGLRQVKDENKIIEMAEVCGITDVLHKSIIELSKGYKQRVGLASTMLHDPDILILDEPTSGLDPNQIVEIRNLIKEIGKVKTVILSTHILSEVEATCDRVIIINKGSIVADDRTENLQAQSSNENNITVKVSGAEFQILSQEFEKIEGVNKVIETTDFEDLTSAIISTTSNEDIRPHLYDCIKKNDWVLYELKQEHLSLENIFRELTLGGGNE